LAELVPAPFSSLLRRAFAEHRRQQKIFDLPARKFFTGERRLDTSVVFHGERASTPLGPAAGPQTQMAQNLALAWLAGARILELKTVQINDRLEIPRPCIDARTIGYNVEWSQELRLAQSIREYAAGWALIAFLRAEGIPSEAAAGARGETIFDLSVGYDLAGISSEPMTAFLRAARDISPILDALRAEIPPELSHLRRIHVRPEMSRSITLSTFHGCPADEIEGICRFLLEEMGFHVVVKLNPTLLGFERTASILHGALGYSDVALSREAFEKDLQWEQAAEMIPRLGELARRRGLGFGVKLTNTLVVENRDRYFREPVMYLSGEPLHVLTMNLALRVRETFGDALPISFSAGIDRTNFPDVAALGFVPVTTCTDLLRPGGYGRLRSYMDHLEERMEAAGAATLDEFILGRERPAAGEPGARSLPDRASVSRAALFNTRPAVGRATADPRYRRENNATTPRKIGSKLALFDCINCDKCIPVCPNDANFVYETSPDEIPYSDLAVRGGRVREDGGGVFRVAKSHQIGVFADFCNECGNCDVFCPEDGGPYLVKPRFFGSVEQWTKWREMDGLFVEKTGGLVSIRGRAGGVEYTMEMDAVSGRARFDDGSIEAVFDLGTHRVLEAKVLPGAQEAHILRVGRYHAFRVLAAAVMDATLANPLNAKMLPL
jgi:putative selenate reductase